MPSPGRYQVDHVQAGRMVDHVSSVMKFGKWFMPKLQGSLEQISYEINSEADEVEQWGKNLKSPISTELLS